MVQRFQQVNLIRHGESLGNLKHGYIDGQNLPVELSPYGEQQAAELGVTYPLAPQTLLVPSAARRAIQTAEIAWPDHKLETPDKRFVELSQGRDEGRLRSDVVTPAYLTALDEGGWDHRVPGGESLQEVADRMLDGVNHWAEVADGKPIVVISHTAAIRGLTGRINRLSQYDAIRRQHIRNTQVTRISNHGRGWMVDFVGLDAGVVAAEDRKHG